MSTLVILYPFSIEQLSETAFQRKSTMTSRQRQRDGLQTKTDRWPSGVCSLYLEVLVVRCVFWALGSHHCSPWQHCVCLTPALEIVRVSVWSKDDGGCSRNQEGKCQQGRKATEFSASTTASHWPTGGGECDNKA